MRDPDQRPHFMASDLGLDSLPMKGSRHINNMGYAASTFLRSIPLKQITLDISYSESSGGVCCLIMTDDQISCFLGVLFPK